MIVIQDKALMQHVDVLTESTLDNGDVKLRFRCHLHDKQRNNNTRIYDDPALNVIHSQLAPKADKRKLPGEMGHPIGGDPSSLARRMGTIDPNNVSVLYTKLIRTSKGIQAEAETLTNSKGRDLYNLIKDNVEIGFSYRGFGRADSDNRVMANTVKSITYDVVFNESNNGAVIIDLLNENTNDYLSMYKTLIEAEDTLNTMLLESEQQFVECPTGQCNIDNVNMLKEFILENIDMTNNYKHIQLKLR